MLRFLTAVSVCPVYCRFCTRSYSVGAPTDEVSSKKSFTPTRRRWENMFGYIENTPCLTDIVVSGGDSYYLPAEHLISIGERLLSVPHIRRIRIASKGLAVCPSRILSPGDPWTAGLIGLSKTAWELGKSVALHTHFNHPREMTWVSRLAAQKLYGEGVTVRNQTVLLRGVNDDIETMKELVRTLADNNITPVSNGNLANIRCVANRFVSQVLHLPRRYGLGCRGLANSVVHHTRDRTTHTRIHRWIRHSQLRSRSSGRRRKASREFLRQL